MLYRSGKWMIYSMMTNAWIYSPFKKISDTKPPNTINNFRVAPSFALECNTESNFSHLYGGCLFRDSYSLAPRICDYCLWSYKQFPFLHPQKTTKINSRMALRSNYVYWHNFAHCFAFTNRRCHESIHISLPPACCYRRYSYEAAAFLVSWDIHHTLLRKLLSYTRNRKFSKFERCHGWSSRQRTYMPWCERSRNWNR